MMNACACAQGAGACSAGWLLLHTHPLKCAMPASRTCLRSLAAPKRATSDSPSDAGKAPLGTAADSEEAVAVLLASLLALGRPLLSTALSSAAGAAAASADS